MKVLKENIKNEVIEPKASTGQKALTGYEVVNTASDIFREEASQTEYMSAGDYKAKVLNTLFDFVDKPKKEFTSLMPIPSWSSQRGNYISADAYRTRVTNLQKSVYEMKANLARELDLKAGQYTVGERGAMLDRIQELNDMLQTCDVELQKVNSDIKTAKILQELEDEDLI